MTIIVLGLSFGCQTVTSSTTKTENLSDAVSKEKEVKTADSHEHEAEGEVRRISLEDAKAVFDKGDAFFVDTRSKNAFENEHIKGAVNIPWKEIEERYEEIPKDKTIIVYCS